MKPKFITAELDSLILPNQRVLGNFCPGRPSTVVVEGLKDSTSELTYVEWLNSLGGAFKRRCTAVSAVSIGLVMDDERNRWVYRGSAFVLYATAQLAQYAIDNLNGKLVWETGRWLYVKQSRCPISTKTSRCGSLIGQPRTGDHIFATTHPGYDDW